MIDDARVAWTAYTLPVESENRTLVDLASAEAEKPWLAWMIEWRKAGLVSLGPNKVKRQFGQLLIAAKVKTGQGTSGPLKLVQHVMPFVEMKGVVLTVSVGEVLRGSDANGIYTLPAVFTFWIDSLVA